MSSYARRIKRTKAIREAKKERAEHVKYLDENGYEHYEEFIPGLGWRDSQRPYLKRGCSLKYYQERVAEQKQTQKTELAKLMETLSESDKRKLFKGGIR